MTNLGAFRKVAAASFKVHCTECGEQTDCLVFWREPDPGREPDAALCRRCILNAEGQYKQWTPTKLLRECETVLDVHERDGAVIVTAQSVLGGIQYLHHTAHTGTLIGQLERQHRRIGNEQTRRLTGEVEAFDESGEFLAAASPYTDVAAEYLSHA